MSTSALCKITYLLNSSQQQPVQQNSQNQCLIQKSVEVVPGMTTKLIAELLGNNLGCGYLPQIQIQIKDQLYNILNQGPNPTHLPKQQAEWLIQMQKIIGIQPNNSQLDFHEHLQQSGLTSQLSQKRSSSRYFQVNYDKFFKNKSERIFPQLNKENKLPIYQRSIRKRKQTQDKLKMIKKQKLDHQISQCTFSPNIQNTLDFFNKKNPKFFDKNEDEASSKKNTFEKLYKQSFDMREKKKQRMKTLQNEQQTKISELSFIPIINQCSKQICKMKSYASFMSQLSQIHQNQQKQTTDKMVVRNNQQTAKKNQVKNYNFHPQISENTKKLTKNLPSFYDRLQQSKEKKKKVKQNVKSQNFTRNKQTTPKVACNSNKLKLKKQLYTIEDSTFYNYDQKQTQKKAKKNGEKSDIIQIQSNQKVTFSNKQQKQISDSQNPSFNSSKQIKRSHQLFNNRKKIIFQAIFNFLTMRPLMNVHQFSHKKFANKTIKEVEIFAYDLLQNHYLPKSIKQIFEPIAQQLGEAQISLSKEQFVWAAQKLFEALSLGQRGSLLGWGVKLLPEQIK